MKHNLTSTKIIFTLIILSITTLIFGGSVTISQISLPNQDQFSNYLTEQQILQTLAAYRQNASPAAALSVPALVYHGVVDQPDGFNVTIDQFRDQIVALKSAGYQTVSLSDYYDFIQGRKSLPQKSFLLTFDDGRRDSYYNTQPLLEALDYHAVMFVIVGDIETSPHPANYYLSSSELERMIDSGQWSIEPHTFSSHDLVPINSQGHTGPELTNLLWLADQNRLETTDEYLNRVSTDLSSAKTYLENRFGQPVSAFAYPFGDYGQYQSNNPQISSLLTQAVDSIYQLSFAQSDQTEIFGSQKSLLRRITVRPDWNGSALVGLLNQYLDKPLPYTDDLSHNQSWISQWGELEFGPSWMQISAQTDGTDASAILNGSATWNYFSATAAVKNFTGTTLSVSSADFTCTFSSSGVKLFRKSISETTPALFWKYKSELDAPFTIGLTVGSNQVLCLVDNTPAIRADTITSSAYQGPLGLSVWSPTAGEAKLVVDKVTALP